GCQRRLRRGRRRHHLRWHGLWRHPLLGHRRLRRIWKGWLRLPRIGLGRVGLALRLRAGVRDSLRRRGVAGLALRVAGLLLRVAARPPRWSGRHAGLARRRPGLWGSLRRHPGVLPRSRPLLLPGRWRLPRARLRIGRVDGCDRPLLIWRNVGRRGALQDRLTASQQVQQPGFVDVQVAGEAGVDAWSEHELAALEFPEEIEGLTRTADAASGGVRQRPALEGVDPLPTGLSEFEHAGLAVVDNLVEQPK